MIFEYSPYIFPLIFAALVAASVGLFVWARLSANGAAGLLILSASIFIWSVGYSLEIAGADLDTKYFWGVVQYAGIAFTPYGWFIFSLAYGDLAKVLTRRFVILTALIPFITVLLAWTTKWHGLIWSEYHINRQGAFSAIGASYGSWFLIHFAYSYILLLAGTAFLVRVLWRRQGLYRGQVISLLIAVIVPWVSNILYFTGYSPIPYLDLTPFAFTISVVALGSAIFGFHLVDITPLARDSVVDSMREGMIVLNVRGNIVDINGAAARMIGIPASHVIGKTIGDAFFPWPHLVERFRNALEDVKDEISVGEGEAKRRYDVSLSPLQDSQGQIVGRVIMLRAMEDEIPRPRFAAESAIPPHLITPILQSDPEIKNTVSAIGWLVNFFNAADKIDLVIPPDTNPSWYQTGERSFTTIVRISAFLGMFAYVFTLPFVRATALSGINVVYGIVIGLLWFLGLARKVNFRYRTVIFLALLYISGFVETLNFGYSVESFLFFMTAIITAVLLIGRAGGWVTAGFSILTLGIFGFLIGKGNFVPFKLLAGVVAPRSFETGITSLAVFSASALAISTTITILVDSMNRAWQLETQALNLLQQERDLLEKRVEERTSDLADARDSAVRSSGELRKYYRAIEQSGNTVIVMDKNGLIEYVNPKFSEVTGYSSEEVLGKSPVVLMSGMGDSQDIGSADWWLTVNAGKIWRGEFRNKRKNGSLFWESATIAPVTNHDNEIINFVEINEDITEEKLLQEQLQNQNDYLSILHQITLDLLNRREISDLLQVIVDRSAVLLDAPFSELMLEKDNLLVVEAFTQNQTSLKGDRVSRDQARLSWEAFDTHQPVTLEDYSTWEYRRFPSRDSRTLHATAEFPVMAGERCLGVLALGRSQPDYKFTAEQIETGILFARLVALVLDNAQLYTNALESEARFRQIVENASDIIYRADMNGQFTYANPAALKMMGYKAEQEVLGKNYLDLTTPEFRHKLKRTYDHQYISKIMNTYYEFPAVNTDGEIVWVGQNVQLITEGDQIAGFQAVARNITEIKEAQEALAISRDQALNASRLKSQLLSRVSHELRTPLGGILGFSELLQYKTFGELNEKQDGAVSNIIKSANYLTSMVNDLLDEAQIESKSLILNTAYFNPVELMERVNTSMSVLADKKGIALRTEIFPEIPAELCGDVKRLQQIIVNLVGNAIKFTSKGEIHVSLKRSTPTRWSIEVRDTGAGIPASEHELIFEPFRQVDNSITRENRGSGLGLAITKQLVDLMDGQIQIESEIGKGSLFIITLPIMNAPKE